MYIIINNAAWLYKKKVQQKLQLVPTFYYRLLEIITGTRHSRNPTIDIEVGDAGISSGLVTSI